MSTFARTDTSMVGRWWWTVDRWMLVVVALLIGTGFVLTMAASPAVAERLDLSSYHFVKRQVMFLVPALVLMLTVSLMSPIAIRRAACIAFFIGLCLMVATLLVGPEIKGAQRWLQIASFTMQPSEFVKPAFIVVSAWMFAEAQRDSSFPGVRINILLYISVVGLLILQPDFGQMALISTTWLFQFFLAGLPWIWVGGLALAGVAALGSAYLLLPHVASRIDRFIDPSSGDTYQIDTALNAFRTGGLFGRGPGEGVVKRVLPDAHTDFIFAVAGEEFGLLLCLCLCAMFALIVLRGFARLHRENDLFIMLAGAGLLCLFGLQALVNIGVNLAMLPSKGMTLPFISYGGSSLVALAITIGMVLGLTRGRTSDTGGWR